MAKKASWKVTPSDLKFPRRKEDPESTDKQTIVWHLNILDANGPWGWRGCSGTHFWDIILNRISSFERMTWAEILRGKDNHQVPVNQICSDAQQRLSAIRQDDIAELYSLSLANKPRLWGIRDGRVFKVLWWDPEHTVYPCPKKHT